MRVRRLVVSLVLLGLSGCAEMVGLPEQPPPGAAPANGVARSSEKGGRFLAFVGPRRQHARPFLGVPGTNFYLLRSWVDAQSGERVHQLYVEDSYVGAERNYDATHDGAGEKLRFIPISKNEIACENGCSYAEEFAAQLPEPLLRAHPHGLTVVFAAKSGPDLKIEVPGELVEKQLAAVDAAAVKPATAAAAAPR